MQALVKYEVGKEKVRLMQREVPPLAAGQARVRVHYAGICGTDIHIFKDDGSYHTDPPVTLGHEFSGIVDSVGEGVADTWVGKRVVGETYYYTCGHCFYCQTGQKNLCPERRSIGSGADGTMADYVVVPARNLHALPDSISLREAALTEPLACCIQAVLEKGNITAGDKILITGPGAIGLMCLQAALLCGGQVVVAGTSKDAERLKMAQQFGAQQCVMTDAEGAEEKIQALFAPYGPDIVFECSGAGPAIQMALRLVRKGGRYIQVGLTGRFTEVDMNLITLKDLQIAGTFAQKPVWWMRALDLLAQKKIRLEPLISGVMPLEKWKEAFSLYSGGSGLKYLLSTTKPDT